MKINKIKEIEQRLINVEARQLLLKEALLDLDSSQQKAVNSNAPKLVISNNLNHYGDLEFSNGY